MADVIIVRFLALMAASMAYAYVLSRPRVHEWYEPRWTWLTVVGGNAMIGLTLWSIELAGVPLTFWLVLMANVVAGIPIIIWQVAQEIRRRERNGHH